MTTRNTVFRSNDRLWKISKARFKRNLDTFSFASLVWSRRQGRDTEGRGIQTTRWQRAPELRPEESLVHKRHPGRESFTTPHASYHLWGFTLFTPFNPIASRPLPPPGQHWPEKYSFLIHVGFKKRQVYGRQTVQINASSTISTENVRRQRSYGWAASFECVALQLKLRRRVFLSEFRQSTDEWPHGWKVLCKSSRH